MIAPVLPTTCLPAMVKTLDGLAPVPAPFPAGVTVVTVAPPPVAPVAPELPPVVEDAGAKAGTGVPGPAGVPLDS